MDWTPIQCSKGQMLARETETAVFESYMRDGGCAPLESPILGQDGRLMLPGLQWWFNIDRFIV